ncbi:hypothetical protein GW17_00035981 [Ensete ventricosum]|nr:hypothetical protein GW17_00035981 [Ensete ventricosum]
MVDITALHLEGDEIQWYDWFDFHTHGVPIWRFVLALKRALEPRSSLQKGRLLMIEPIEEEDLEHEEEDLDDEEEDTDEESQPVDCMMHALAGYVNPQMMKVGGLLKQYPITILIDTESTNNFMNNKVAARMALAIEHCSKFDVKVADSQILKCDRRCLQMKLLMQD